MRCDVSVNQSLAGWPGLTHDQAVSEAIELHGNGELSEPLWGNTSIDHIQIVPQNMGIFGVGEALLFKNKYPDIQFRLHANVRVLPSRKEYDLSNFDETLSFFKYASDVQAALGAQVYSAHAGYRKNATLAQMFDNAKRATDLFGHPVAIEGLYPDKGRTQLLDSWDEYAMLLESGLPYALDLSHLNIVARHEKKKELGLVAEMLSSPACLEVHVSANNGTGDSHQVCDPQLYGTPWWAQALEHIHPEAVVFTEGNQRRRIHKINQGQGA